jgi:hypothetical protein
MAQQQEHANQTGTGQDWKLLVHVNINTDNILQILCYTLMFLAIDCGPPPPLENGQIDVLDQTTAFQSVVQYKCIDGYILEGEASRTCKADRSWSGIQPVCRGKHIIRIIYYLY